MIAQRVVMLAGILGGIHVTMGGGMFVGVVPRFLVVVEGSLVVSLGVGVRRQVAQIGHRKDQGQPDPEGVPGVLSTHPHGRKIVSIRPVVNSG